MIKTVIAAAAEYFFGFSFWSKGALAYAKVRK
jgi:hypothetical protein